MNTTRFRGFLAGAFATFAAAGPTPAQQLGKAEPPAPLLTAMIGDWDVDQSMWTGLDAAPVTLPKAVAIRRSAAGGGFLQEQMTLATSSDEPFTRTAHVNWNPIDGKFEYFSVDSRAPQQMHYQSQPAAATFIGDLRFSGATSVAAQWGDKKNAAFAYRIELSPVSVDRQTMRLYLRPLETGAPREFIAFRYDYRRRR